jgi:hypothetical protein
MLREGYWNQQRRGEDAIDRCRELWNEMDAVDCERENILCRDSALLKKNDQESIQQKPLEWEKCLEEELSSDWLPKRRRT